MKIRFLMPEVTLEAKDIKTILEVKAKVDQLTREMEKAGLKVNRQMIMNTIHHMACKEVFNDSFEKMLWEAWQILDTPSALFSTTKDSMKEFVEKKWGKKW